MDWLKGWEACTISILYTENEHLSQHIEKSDICVLLALEIIMSTFIAGSFNTKLLYIYEYDCILSVCLTRLAF